METNHTFTEAGLGEAPFSFDGIRENLFQAAVGDPVKPGGCCAYCFQGIRWEYQIRSADGKVSTVGSECIRKAGNKGLFDVAKKAKRDHDREIKRLDREAHIVARQNEERAANGGATDWERGDAERDARKFDRRLALAPAIEILSRLADLLDDGRGGFAESVAGDFRTGTRVSDNVARIAAEIIAKSAGRKNSKAWKAELEVVSAEINGALELIDSV